MRLIDADACESYFYEHLDDSGMAAAMNAINDMPTIEPRKRGKWIDETFKPWGLVHHPYKCDQCGEHSESDSDFCPNCGADMRNPIDIAKDIAHEAIDNSVWSDSVDTAEMHKVVDDKYMEMTEGEA